jgi:hypothetical protein
MSYNERLRYLDLTRKQHTGKKKAIEIIMRETKFQGTVEDMAHNEQSRHIHKKGLVCDRCNTNEHIVAEPVVFNYQGDLTDNVEYYCENPNTGSLLFSKCWNHVQGYENRRGDNKLTLIQERV